LISSDKDILPLWCAQVQNDAQLKYDFLSVSERARFKKIKRAHKQQEYLLSRALMRTACSTYFNIDANTLVFKERPNALPIISPLPENFFYSLSHSKGLIFFAISSLPIGIDIEKRLPRANLLDAAEFFMSCTELKNLLSLTSDSLTYFYRLWCAKEAYFKSLSPKQQQNISLQTIDYHSLCTINKGTSLLEKEIDQYCLAVFSQKNYKDITINPLSVNQYSIENACQ